MEEDPKKTEHLTGSKEGGTDMPPSEGAGEDDGSTSVNGEDGHLKDQQKPTEK